MFLLQVSLPSPPRAARSPPLYCFPLFRLPGRPVTAAAVLTSACARTGLRAHPRARAPTHAHVFTTQGKLGPFVCLSVPGRARRRCTRRELRRRRRGSFRSEL
jgi:hypothetical protein